MELLKKGTCKDHAHLHTHMHAHLRTHLHTHRHSLSGTLTSRASHPSSGVCAKACPLCRGQELSGVSLTSAADTQTHPRSDGAERNLAQLPRHRGSQASCQLQNGASGRRDRRSPRELVNPICPQAGGGERCPPPVSRGHKATVMKASCGHGGQTLLHRCCRFCRSSLRAAVCGEAGWVAPPSPPAHRTRRAPPPCTQYC